ncbi:putative zinc finger BED domain-containing protein RICESLEEPER 2-like [Iris pallida]|uniref:Zinc finger BED domain-containing protein RICESLEEPER 2-like n=1 Tax=Iris pallida TaxID=29817 RepID=A0AAX6E8R3_IRIPA|nr:putative zinc finger BED domain-containing protein RICESLEEPER 2-like [Iris pallida]
MFIWLVFPSLVQLTSSCLTTKAGRIRLVSDYSGAGHDMSTCISGQTL